MRVLPGEICGVRGDCLNFLQLFHSAHLCILFPWLYFLGKKMDVGCIFNKPNMFILLIIVFHSGLCLTFP